METNATRREAPITLQFAINLAGEQRPNQGVRGMIRSFISRARGHHTVERPVFLSILGPNRTTLSHSAAMNWHDCRQWVATQINNLHETRAENAGNNRLLIRSHDNAAAQRFARKLVERFRELQGPTDDTDSISSAASQHSEFPWDAFGYDTPQREVSADFYGYLESADSTEAVSVNSRHIYVNPDSLPSHADSNPEEPGTRQPPQ